MAEEKQTSVNEGYNPGPLAETVLQRGLNPAPLSQAVQQVTQGSNPAPMPVSPSNSQPANNTSMSNPK